MEAVPIDYSLYPQSPTYEDLPNYNESLQPINLEPHPALRTLQMNSTRPIEFWKKMIPNFNKILDHGCWCSALVHNKFPNTEPLDQLDMICQSWTVCRRCTRETETACLSGYDKKTSISEVDNYQYQCNAADDCTNGLCRCNMDFVVEISDFFQDYFQIFEEFEPEVADRAKCGLPRLDEDLFTVHVDDVKEPGKIFSRKAPAGGNPLAESESDDLEVALNLDKIINDNEFIRSFSFIDERSVKEKAKNKMPSTIKIRKEKIKQLQDSDELQTLLIASETGALLNVDHFYEFRTGLGDDLENFSDLPSSNSNLDDFYTGAGLASGEVVNLRVDLNSKDKAYLGTSLNHPRGPATITINSRKSDITKIFGDPIKTGKKCCGHAPNFRLYNPNTDFCDIF